jgi:hypothetical protein
LSENDFLNLRNEIINSSEYKNSIEKISTFIHNNPTFVARYFFGVRPNDFFNDNEINPDVPCGTSGASVSYLGKMFNTLLNLLSSSTIRNLNYDKYKQKIADELNNVIKNNPSPRITIADARILNLVSLDNNDKKNLIDFLHLLLSFITDYKRTGDYQQVYSVLKIIEENHNLYIQNKTSKKFVFSTGDELASVLSRMCKIPSIYQNSTANKMFLYRSNSFYYTPEEKELNERNNKIYMLKNKVTITFNDTKVTYIELLNKYNKITAFIKKNYGTICKIRDEIYKMYNQMLLNQVNYFQLYVLHLDFHTNLPR